MEIWDTEHKTEAQTDACSLPRLKKKQINKNNKTNWQTKADHINVGTQELKNLVEQAEERWRVQGADLGGRGTISRAARKSAEYRTNFKCP